MRGFVDGTGEYIRLQHHAHTTTCWVVINGAVLVRGEAANILRFQRPLALTQSPPREGMAKKQRDRILSNEYLVKVYLFWDALSRGRTDGALVRIASLVGPGETEDIVDARLRRFVATIDPEMIRYVPD